MLAQTRRKLALGWRSAIDHIALHYSRRFNHPDMPAVTSCIRMRLKPAKRRRSPVAREVRRSGAAPRQFLHMAQSVSGKLNTQSVSPQGLS